MTRWRNGYIAQQLGHSVCVCAQNSLPAESVLWTAARIRNLMVRLTPWWSACLRTSRLRYGL